MPLRRVPSALLQLLFIVSMPLVISTPLVAGVDAMFLRYPDVSQDQIAFVYAGDIWLVPKAGGQATRLSTPAGEEAFPRFSPDGTRVAFSGNYDGNTDIYVAPVKGGLPQRLTHHPMNDRMLDWYPDGKSILYGTSMNSGKQRFLQLYRLPAEGGLPEKLPLPYGEFGSISADGKTLAYMPVSRDFRTWKRYRGGMTTDIWLFDLETHSAKNITAHKSNNGQPMWHGKKLYFQSDRDEAQRSNIWVLDTTTGQTRQITRFETFDVRFPAIGPSDLVFENGGRLYVMDLATETHKEVKIDVVTDRATLKAQAKNVGGMLQSFDVSPSGKRAVIQARGEIFTVPAEHGIIRNLSRSSGAAERHPAWSPDGKEIAYFSDRTGEYELTVRNADGSGDETTLTKLGPGFRYFIFWSPDSKQLAFIDQTMTIRIHDRGSKKTTVVDKGLAMYQGPLSGWVPSWSADSRWLAYHRDLNSGLNAVYLYDTKNGRGHQVTSGFYDCSHPAFDPDGKYLYFRTMRDFEPVYSDIDTTWVYNNMTRIAVVPLRKDVPSPLAPRNDDEGDKDKDKDDDDKKKDDDKKDKKKDKDAEDEADEDKDEDKKKDKDEKKPEPVEIDIDGFERRLVLLPAKAGNYGGLVAVSGKVLYQRRPRSGSGAEEGPVVFYDLKEREEKTILKDADWFVLASGGEKLLAAKDETIAIIDVKADQKLEKNLRTSELSMTLDPAAEWKQIFNDAWRLERDFFYDPGMHGVDWEEMRRRYGSLVEQAVTRWDVDFLLGELIGEMNASHTYRFGGDTERSARMGVGLLGADFTLENGAYRIHKIVDGAIWDSEVRSPLNEPGLKVNQGDYLLAVNGVPLDTTKDPWAALQGLADKTVMLTVNDTPNLKGAREVLVQTLSDETRLRNLAWIEQNRQYVEDQTGGRAGYIFVPSTGIDGQNELLRMFTGQFKKDALIIDERWNNGGQIPSRFVEMLNRPIYNYWGVRDGQDWQWPPTAHVGPKVMLINQWSGSGGDLFPYYFKKAGLGPLIGITTWGGLIGYTGVPSLIDGGAVTVPTFGIYNTEGEWIIEGVGVPPDIEVVDDPSLMTDGGDPQLDAAIAEILRRLESDPPRHPAKPAYPKRGGR